MSASAVDDGNRSMMALDSSVPSFIRDNIALLIQGAAGIEESDVGGRSKGVDQHFLDELERVNVKKELKQDAACAICTNEFHQDPHPLVVRLPCNEKHLFDMDCIGPWLKFNRTCPMCRKDVTVKERVVLEDSEEEEEDWELYG